MARKRKPKKGGPGGPAKAASGRKGKAASEKGEAPKEGNRGRWAERARSIAWAVGVVLFVRIFLFETFVIDSGSMMNTLLVGDYLAVNKLAIGPRVPFTNLRIPGYSKPRRGNILVFDPHHEENMTVVKRVVGMPGDTLEMRDKALLVNGDAYDEPYVETLGVRDDYDPQTSWQNDHLLGGPRDDYRPTPDNWGPLVVPPDHYFMLGDYRDDSLDSRVWGFLEGWRFKGRVAFIYFSYDRDSYRPFPWITGIRGSRIGDRVR
ncbi:MAG: signal peptidase I [Gemmatimonadetes bacterium]|nr:signal peptidase I [Gemmatimonadota bacterium]MYJ69901.1 signal peptidase I [Gemmatimonadota bacterium]